MAFRIILFFTNEQQGWQEVYYTNNSTFANAEELTQQLIAGRRPLMGQPTKIHGYRLSDESNPRASVLVSVFYPSTGTYASRSDKVESAAMARLYNVASDRSRPLYLRGNPDDLFDTEQPDNADAQQWTAAFGNFKAVLKNGSFQIKVRPRPTPLTVGTITAWTTTTPSKNSLMTVDTPPGLTPPYFVQTYGVAGLPFAPGLVKVVKETADVLTIVYRTPPDFVYQNGGTWLLYEPAYEIIGSVAFLPRFSNRKTGRPFDLTRGARRPIRR